MIRYVMHLPHGASRESTSEFARMLEEAADDRKWRDLVFSEGVTLERLDLRGTRRPVWVKRAMFA